MEAARICGLEVQACSFHLITAQREWVKKECGPAWKSMMDGQILKTLEYLRFAAQFPFGTKSELLELVEGCPEKVKKYLKDYYSAFRNFGQTT